jgi:hypothetical protein
MIIQLVLISNRKLSGNNKDKIKKKLTNIKKDTNTNKGKTQTQTKKSNCKTCQNNLLEERMVFQHQEQTNKSK